MKWLYVWVFAAILMAVVGVVTVNVSEVLAQECDLGLYQYEYTKPRLSANGQFIVFKSIASLVPDDTNGILDIFVFDRQTGETTRVSVASDGTQANLDSTNGYISADGRYVTFNSYASNLVPDDTNTTSDVFVHDRQTGETTRVSIASDGAEGDSLSNLAEISADGRYVTFTSMSTNLVLNDTNGYADVFVHDRQTGETTRVSVTSYGSQAYDSSGGSSISADGRYVAFTSRADLAPTADTNDALDVFVHDRQTGETTRVSVASDGTEGDSLSNLAEISADGQYVAFSSIATNLVPDDTNMANDVFVHDRQTGETTRVSVANDGTEGNNSSSQGEISADGRYVIFSSYASNLVPDDTNTTSDVFVYDRQTGETTRVSIMGDSQLNSLSSGGTISTNGRIVSFTSYYPSADGTGEYDIFVHDRQTGITNLALCDSPPANALITGAVQDHEGTMLAGVDIVANPGGFTAKTDAQGIYTLSLPEGTYHVSVAVPGNTSYPLQRAVVVGGDQSILPFTYYPCISPHTSLDVCELEVGDILFERSSSWAQNPLRIALQTYWWHSGMFTGNNSVSHAVGLKPDDNDEVVTQPIFETSWWKSDFAQLGSDIYDWAVIRPNTELAIKTQASNYVAYQAERENPPARYIPYSDPDLVDVFEMYRNYRDSEILFYCNQLVWKSYEKLGLDLEHDGWLSSLGVVPTVIREIITGDDLYASQQDNLSELHQINPDDTIVRRIVLIILRPEGTNSGAIAAATQSYNAPVRVVITDSQGRRVGHESSSGETFNEIPGAAYIAPGDTPETFSFKVRESEAYTMTVTGVEGGEYAVFSRILADSDGISDSTQSTTTAGQSDVFVIDPFAEKEEGIIEVVNVEIPPSTLQYVFLPIALNE